MNRSLMYFNIHLCREEIITLYHSYFSRRSTTTTTRWRLVHGVISRRHYRHQHHRVSTSTRRLGIHICKVHDVQAGASIHVRAPSTSRVTLGATATHGAGHGRVRLRSIDRAPSIIIGIMIGITIGVVTFSRRALRAQHAAAQPPQSLALRTTTKMTTTAVARRRALQQ